MRGQKPQPTPLEVARQVEKIAKDTMGSAKKAYKEAHAAWDAIGVLVTKLEAQTEEEKN